MVKNNNLPYFCRNMKKISIKIFLLLFLISPILVAQPGNGDPPAEAPISGGILYLLLGGLAYGFVQLKKIISSNKKN